MQHLSVDTTAIYIVKLDDQRFDGAIDGVASARRRREIAAARFLVTRLFGPGTSIVHSPQGAPSLSGRDMPFISISHSTDSLVLAVDKTRPVGVDIEHARPNLSKVATRFLTEPERDLCPTFHDLLAAWTAKEALFKIAGKQGTTLIDLPLPDADGTATVDARLYRLTRVIDTADTVMTLATLL